MLTYIYMCVCVGEDEHPRSRARRKSRGPGGEVNPYFTPPPPGGFISAPPSPPPPSSPVPPTPSHRLLACFVPTLSLATTSTTYIHPLKDHAPARNQGWGLKSTRSKGCLRPDTLVTEPFFFPFPFSFSSSRFLLAALALRGNNDEKRCNIGGTSKTKEGGDGA